MREEVRSTTAGQRLMAWLLSFLLAAMMFAPATTAEAATYTSGTITSGDQQSLSINNGMSVLTVGTGDDAKTIQLTKELVTKDGGIDATTGTVYLLWMSNSLYGYNYELQKDGNVQLFLVDSGVISFTTSGTDITGYDTSGGHKSLLTLVEVKSKLGINDTPSGDEPSGDTPSGDKPSGDTPSGDEPSGDKPSGDTPSGDEPSGDKQSGNTPSGNAKSGDNSSSSATTTENSNTGSNSTDKTNIANSMKQLLVKNNVATLKVTTNGKTKSYKLPTAKVGAAVVDARFDKNGTIWVRYANGQLDIWNYDLQKSQSKIKLYTISKKSTALVVENALVTGYYVSGKAAKQPIWSKAKIKKKLGITTTTSKKTTTSKSPLSKTSSKVSKANSKRNYQMITYRAVRALQNVKGNTVDRFSLNKKGILSYNGVKYKKVRYAAFNAKGNLIVLYKNGKLSKIKHTNMKVKKLATDISHLNYTKHGLAKYAVRDSRTRFSIINC